MQLLYALAKLRTPFLDTVLGALTNCGGEIVFMAVAIIVFWCVSKSCGYYMLTVGFVGTIVNQFLKLVFRIPRPWVLDPDFQIVESARAGATGYSFPSGHTQNVVGTLGGKFDIASTLGQGTTVTVTLPVYHPGQEHLHDKI